MAAPKPTSRDPTRADAAAELGGGTAVLPPASGPLAAPGAFATGGRAGAAARRGAMATGAGDGRAAARGAMATGAGDGAAALGAGAAAAASTVTASFMPPAQWPGTPQMK